MKTNLVPLRRPAEAEPTLSDEALALACSTGDAAAVAELFERFRRSVSRYLRRLLDPADADDCLQATFLEVARGHARYEGRSSVSTWLLGIATNVLRHHRRSAGRQARLRGALEQSATSAASDHDGAAAARQTLERLRRVLLSLPEERRVAFVLCELEGLSARDAAELLNVNETAIWKRVSDARKQLRRALTERSS